MRFTITRNEYTATERFCNLIVESLTEMNGDTTKMKVETFEECHKTLSELQEKTTAIKEITYSEESLTVEIKEEFVVDILDNLYTPVTKKVIRLVLVTIDTLKGIMMDAKAAASICVKKWTK